MDINKGVADDKFIMEQPEGTVKQVLGEPSTEPATPSAPPAKGKTKKK